MKNLQERAKFKYNIWILLFVFALLSCVFSIYVWSEKQIDLANNARHKSLLLVNELRQTSDDLTRMARIYATTGNPIHKQYYQNIQDIRDGKKPRPEEYHKPYWFIVLAEGKPPRPDSKETIPLLDLLQQIGLIQEELDILSDIKYKTNLENAIELEAINLVSSPIPNLEANREKARKILHEENFFISKANVLHKIAEFYEQIDSRTQNSVLKNKQLALIMRILLITTATGLFFMLWRTIKQLKDSEDEIFKREKQFRSIFEVNSYGIIYQNNTGEIINANTSAQSLLGLNLKQLKESSSFDFPLKVIKEDGSIFKGEDHPPMIAIQTGKPSSGIMGVFNTKRQSYVWLDVESVPIYTDGDLTPNMVYSIFKDITSHKQSNQSIQDIKIALDDHAIVAITDKYGKITYANKKFCKISQYSKEELIGQTHKIINSGYHPNEFFQNLWETIRNKKIWEGEIKNRAKDGSFYWVYTTITPLFDSNGEISQYIAIRTDITARKLAEESLLASQTHLENIISLMPDIIFRFNKDFIYLDALSSDLSQLLVPKEQIIGKTVFEVLPPGLGKKAANLISKAIESGDEQILEYDLDTPKGKEWFEIRMLRVNSNETIAFARNVTQRKNDQEMLRKSKQQLSHILDNLITGAVQIDLEGQIIYANYKACEILNVERNAITKKYFSSTEWKQIDENGNPFPLDKLPLAVAMREKRPVSNIEHGIIDDALNRKWLIVNAFPILDSENNLQGAIANFIDITDRKLAEKAIIENEKKFRKIFDGMSQGAQIISPDWRYHYVNPTVAKHAKCKIEDLLGYTMMEKFPGIETTELFTKLERCAKEKISDRFENLFTFPDGSVGGFDLSILPIPEGLFVLSIDITARIQAEDALKSSEQRLRAFMDAATDNFSLYDSELNLIDLNDVCLTWLPNLKNREEAIGKHLLELVPGLRGTERYKAYQNVIKTGKPFYADTVLTANSDLGARYISAKAFKVGDGMGLILTDITATKNIEEELRKSKESADAANRAKSEFLASMSHEIRTPLNGVIGFTDLLMKTNLNETQAQYMGIVFKSANSLLDLLNDILDFSKIEAGKLDLAIEKIDIFELLGEASDVIKYKVYEKKLELLLHTPPTLPRFIYADPIRLRQILINLIGNAIKFTSKGEIEIRVEVLEMSDRNESTLLFSVRDTGIGISKEKQKKIFEAFSQEDSTTTRKYGGTGLGLTISNQLLGLMNSKLELESEQGKGSKFYFTIKVKTEEGEKEEWENLETIQNVLIVDDNENNRIILEEMLSLRNIKSTLAANGQEALEALEKFQNFDLMITDYDMPDMNGLELIQRIRIEKNKSSEELLILLLHSSSGDETTDKLSKELNVQLSIQKPIQTKELFKALSKIKPKIKTRMSLEKNITKENKNPVILEKFKILIVDDNPVNLLLAKSMLSKIVPYGIISEARNGKQAIEQWIEETPDIIFMDVQMTEMNGYEATAEIRKTENGETVPIIALTAGTVKEEIEQCYKSGMDDYASKPILQDTFIKILTKWLGAKNSAESKEELQKQIGTNASFNFIEFKFRYEEDKVFLTNILTAASTTFSKSLAELKDSMRERKLEKIHSIAHKMKGTSLTMCCSELSKLAVELEMQKEFDEIVITYLVQKIDLEIQLIQELIAKEITE